VLLALVPYTPMTPPEPFIVYSPVHKYLFRKVVTKHWVLDSLPPSRLTLSIPTCWSKLADIQSNKYSSVSYERKQTGVGGGVGGAQMYSWWVSKSLRGHSDECKIDGAGGKEGPEERRGR